MAVPSRVEEGLVQQRYGYSHDLPDYLEEAEIAFAVDTGGVFIGAPMFKKIDGRERSASNIYPYHNIEILTEVSDNAEIIKVPFTPFNSALAMPIVLIAYNAPNITSNDYILVNGVQLSINATDTTLSAMVNRLNDKLVRQGVTNVNFDIHNDKFKITFYAKDNETLILDGATDMALQNFGFIEYYDKNINHKVITPTHRTSRSLADILSDRVSVKTFGVLNDSSDDSSLLTNAAIDALYRNKKTFLKKDLFFPSGDYAYKTDSIWLNGDTKLVGENIVNVLFDSDQVESMVSNKDADGYSPNVRAYGSNPTPVDNITIDNINFKSNYAIKGIVLYGVHTFTLSNLSIESKVSAPSLIEITYKNTLNDLKDIRINSVRLSNCATGIIIKGETDKNRARNILIKGVKFENISGWCMELTNCENVIIEGCDFSSPTIRGKFLNLKNCKNIVIRDCIYPEGFALVDNTNNKIVFTNSDIRIEDYINIIATGDPSQTKVLTMPDTNTNFNVKMDYDIISPYFINRSGVLNVYYLYGSFNASRFNDSNSGADSSCSFSIANENRCLVVYLNNLHGQKATLRYKLHLTTL